MIEVRRLFARLYAKRPDLFKNMVAGGVVFDYQRLGNFSAAGSISYPITGVAGSGDDLRLLISGGGALFISKFDAASKLFLGKVQFLSLGSALDRYKLHANTHATLTLYRPNRVLVINYTRPTDTDI